jgi:glutamyl/glutaminyl-tRNA synthetase
LFTRDELVAAFSLEGISGGNAVFNPEKLDWFNQQHISRLPLEDLASRVEPILRDAGLWTIELSAARREWFLRVLDLVRTRVKRMDQFAGELRPFLQESVEYDAAAVSKYLGNPAAAAALATLTDALAELEPFKQQALEVTVRGIAEARGLKAAAVIHATRVAVMGRPVSPGLFEVLELLGRERVLARLRHALVLAPK